MRPPDVLSTMRDERHNVTYHFVAYRTLTRDEMLTGIAMLHGQPSMRRRKKPIRNQTFTVQTIHGATPRL